MPDQGRSLPAMVLSVSEACFGPFDGRIKGTGNNRPVRPEAQRAVRSDATLQPVPPRLRKQSLMPDEKMRPGVLRVRRDLRSRVNFVQITPIARPFPVDTGIDVIFLRSVLIYFSEGNQAGVMSCLTDHLAPQGHLIVGQEENMVVCHDCLQLVGPAIFRKE